MLRLIQYLSIATKQQIAGFPTISDKVIFPTVVKPLISNKNVQNRPESEQFREMLGVFYFQKQIRKPGAGKEVMQMPRMPKYLKREWAFFLGDCGRKKYNPLTPLILFIVCLWYMFSLKSDKIIREFCS